MKTILQTPLGEITDRDILETLQDLCQMLGWRATEYPDHPLFDFLGMVMMQESKSISLSHIPCPLVVDRKMGNLLDHGFYPVCKALKNGDTLEQHANITLLVFLKRHFAYLRTPSTEPRGLTDHELDMRIIRQRRNNAS